MWIHKHENWTNFTWNQADLAPSLAELRHRQGRLAGRLESLGFEFQNEAVLKTLIADVQKSSAIEGENFNTDEVRSSVAQRLGVDIAGLKPPSRKVDSTVAMMLNATQNYADPLTQKRLFGWHAALFPTGYNDFHKIHTAAWRTGKRGPMRVLSGAYGKEKIHFEAPAADRVPAEMRSFLRWFEAKQTIDPVLKAGIAHFYFVTIHPFEDGNGRIARAIGDMALARAEASPQRFYSLSAQIEAERKQYYAELERQQRSTPDLTTWLSWFLACLARAIESAEVSLSQILYKARVWEQLRPYPINERQRLVLNRMLSENFTGYLNSSKYAKLAKCSTDTALRDIQKLQSTGVLTQNPARGRSTSYRLADL